MSAAIRIQNLMFRAVVGIFCLVSTGYGQDFSANPESIWASWRGPTQNGVAHAKSDPPVEWSEDKNVKWKTKLQGLGHSTPVVWGKRIVVTSAEPFGPRFEPIPETAPGAHDNNEVTQKHRFLVCCFDRETGKQLWSKIVREVIPNEGGHRTGSLASASPVTDGKHLVAHFGSHGVYCLDFQGNLVWKKDLGRMHSKHAHGEGSSPALDEGLVVINWDHQEQSFVAALDVRSGKVVWKKNRPEVTSWSSPIIVKVDGRKQVIVPGSGRTRGYDLKTGEVIWECAGLSQNVVASPVFEDGIVYVGSSYDTQAFLAIRVSGAQGDITGSEHVLWFRRRHTPYVPSPLIYRNVLYFFRHYQGILFRVDGPSGEEKNAMRLLGITNIYSSPIAAGNRIYIVDRGGRTIVLRHGNPPEALALNRLNDSFSASPIAVGDELILRGESFLYCLKRE